MLRQILRALPGVEPTRNPTLPRLLFHPLTDHPWGFLLWPLDIDPKLEHWLQNLWSLMGSEVLCIWMSKWQASPWPCTFSRTVSAGCCPLCLLLLWHTPQTALHRLPYGDLNKAAHSQRCWPKGLWLSLAFLNCPVAKVSFLTHIQDTSMPKCSSWEALPRLHALFCEWGNCYADQGIDFSRN